MQKICFYSMILIVLPTILLSQQVGDILWMDDFNDDDPEARYEVGWFYYDEADGLMDAVVQQQDNALYFKQGSFTIMGAVIAGTNGVPALETDEDGELTEDTQQDLLSNDFSSPNQQGTFQINFKNVNSSWFIVPTRMLQDDDLTDSDPRETPSYLVYIDPLEGTVGLAKTPEVPMAMLDPNAYEWLADWVEFTFEQDVFYWVKWYLYEGIYKVRIWSGELSDEPDEWLIEAADPEPRVTGMFTYFGLLSPLPESTDEILIDNVTIREVEEGSAVSAQIDKNPKAFVLKQNYPNPFNPSTEIRYSLAKSSYVNLEVFDQNGRFVNRLVSGQQEAGVHSATWNGMDSNGLPAASGIYHARLSTDVGSHMIKMVLLR